MPTNNQIMQDHKHHICNPKAAKGESNLYDQDCVVEMLTEARSDERAKGNYCSLEYLQKTSKDSYEAGQKQARSDTTKKHIGAIWNWWTTKPQKRKNDMSVRIITRADIEELVRMME